METFLKITDIIIEWHENHGDINEVTFGDASEVDSTTHTDFPLVHLIPLSTAYPEGYVNFTFQILYLDINDGSRDERRAVLSFMNKVCNEFVKANQSGSLYDELFRITAVPGADVIYRGHENILFGWSLSYEVSVPNQLLNCG